MRRFGRHRRRPALASVAIVGAALAAGVGVGACSSDGGSTVTEFALEGTVPGDVISLRADGDAIEWIDRRAGVINRAPIDRTGIDLGRTELVATVDVSTEGEQRGLLGTTLIDGRRFAAWTDAQSLDLVVGEIIDGTVARMVWSGTATQSTAIGGHLDTHDGQILLGLGELTGWAQTHGSGALVLLDPDGAADQEPMVLSDDWNNPFAFTVAAGLSGDADESGRAAAVWVADNEPNNGPDPERLGRGDVANGSLRFATAGPQRAPSAIVALPDGRLGVCGFLDGELWAYDVTTPIDADDAVDAGDAVDGTELAPAERAGTIGPCLTAATVTADGTIVTATETGFTTIVP